MEQSHRFLIYRSNLTIKEYDKISRENSDVASHDRNMFLLILIFVIFVIGMLLACCYYGMFRLQ